MVLAARYFTIIFLVFWSYALMAQGPKAPRTMERDDYTVHLDSLREYYGENKELLPKYELQALIALSYFPELKDTRIEFVYKKLKSNLAARPNGLSVFRRKGKRVYKVLVNNTDASKMPIDSASFNAQVGVIAHELSHIAYYESRSSMRVMADGLWYWNLKFRTRFERATDMRTIEHGLGWQLHDFGQFGVDYVKNDPKYSAYKARVYMTPEEIRSAIRERYD